MQRRAIVHLALLAAVIAAATTAIAVVIPWLPQTASRERQGIDLTYWLATGIAIFIFSIVAAAIIYSVWRFRAHPDDDSDGKPIHGHTGLEIVWTAIPTGLVTAIAIVSAIVLHDNGVVPKNALHVDVIAQQFTWTFKYMDGPAKGITAPDLYMPIDRATELDITSLDVIHSFWVPQFGQKQDALPGRHYPLKITPIELGKFPVICTELCGLGHALMRRQAYVLTAKEFAAKKWAVGLQGGPTAPPPPGGGGSSGTPAAGGGKAVFAANGCSACHTLMAAAATGTIGPDLDKLPAEAQRAGQPLTSFVRESIVNPNAYIEPGFPKDTMPKNFGQTISKPDLAALVQYLIQSSKGGGK
ncbi:MAG TPA: cytochrome c oxidase subunit II [Gaiellaceae bacterium]|nr:cytochrome c oxidase subunit II [Gaiellaceae bacterium]